MKENPAKYFALGGLIGIGGVIVFQLGVILGTLLKILEAVRLCGS